MARATAGVRRGPRVAPGQVRIVGGRWRGRRLPVPPVPGLRPTPDRVRETLFNWLAPVLPGARCLDLFAGTGALGFEALSRGASQAVLVDSDPRVVAHLRRTAQSLGAENVQLVSASVPVYLQGPAEPFDVVFLDPPFRAGLLAACAAQLDAGGWLRPGARVYLELEAELGTPELPSGWMLLRSKQAGDVGYHLATLEPG